MKVLFFLILALIEVIAVVAYRTYHLFPLKELRRRARLDKKLSNVYKAASYSFELDLLLYLIIAVDGAVLFIWLYKTSLWLAALGVLVGIWLVHWRPMPTGEGWNWSVANLAAPPLTRIASFIRPATSSLQATFPKFHLSSLIHVHTGVYEREDLAELLDKQAAQIGNRIPDEELEIAKGALSFGDKKVSDAMVPRRMVKMVAADEVVGPHLMDELHASGFTRFPVVKDNKRTSKDEVVGTLYLRDLLNHTGSGTVRDLMKHKVYYINEAQTLRRALDAFLKTHHHQLLVVNNFEEIVGVLSLEDVLEQIIGKPIMDEFDQYEDLRAVAGMEAGAEHQQHVEHHAE